MAVMVGSDFVAGFNFLIFPSSTPAAFGGLATLSEVLESMIHPNETICGQGLLVGCDKMASEIILARLGSRPEWRVVEWMVEMSCWYERGSRGVRCRSVVCRRGMMQWWRS